MKKTRIIFYSLLCFVLVVFLFVKSNLGSIYEFMANRAYKSNNIPKSQEYYEKAFGLGLDNLKSRDIYVNSIINSPFDLDSQRKLLKFMECSKEDRAKRKADSFVSDIRREILKSYPENYITQATYNQQIVRWGKLPITYGCKSNIEIPDYFTKEIENAFNEWEKASAHKLLFSRDDKNPNIIIEFSENNPADRIKLKYVVAYSTPVVNINKLQNTKIIFYLKDPLGKSFTKNQVYNTALHEIVHAVGFMGHSENKEDIMYLSKDSASVLNDKRAKLTVADINTIKLLYNIEPDITNVSEIKADYLPFVVLGSDKDIQAAKLEEAKNYVSKAPKLAGGYIDMAESFVAAKEYDKALKSLKKALSYADTDDIKGMIFYNLAVVYYYSNNTAAAEKYLKKSLQIKKSDEQYYLLAQIYLASGAVNDAVAEYRKLIKKNPHNIEYVISLTNLYIERKDYFKARGVLKDFIKQNPKERKNKRLAPYGILKVFL